MPRAPNQTYAASQLSKWLYSHYHVIREKILIPDEVGEVDFDEVYEQVRDEFDISSLFDNLVDQIGLIIATDLVESRTVSDALERLRVILKSNRKGSQAAIFASMNYAKFFRKTFKGYLEKLGGPAIKAFNEAYDEAKEAVEKVDDEYRKKAMANVLDARFAERIAKLSNEQEVVVEEWLPAGYLNAPENTDTDDANKQ